MAGSVGLFSRISDLWAQFTNKLKGAFGLFTGLAYGLGPALVAVLEKLPKIDLSGLGKRIGESVAILIQAFSDGKLGQLLGLRLKVGVR